MPKSIRCNSNTSTGGKCKRSAIIGKLYCKRHSKTKKTVFELLKQLKEEEGRGKYRILTEPEKTMMRNYYKQEVKLKNIINKMKFGDPVPKESTKFYDLSKDQISNGYSRVVIGDHGSYVEFKKEHICFENVREKEDQKWRKNNHYVKYHWLETRSYKPNGEPTKIYKQVKTVKYADYKVNRYYISTKDLIT